jgi:hypothetical protein
MASVLRAEFGGVLPGGLPPERVAPLLVAVMDGLQFQWLLDPEAVDMPGAFRDFVTLLGALPGAVVDRKDAEGTTGTEDAEVR